MSELKNIRKQLDTKYEELKKELQDACPHTELSDWMYVYPSGDVQVIRCLRCDKVVQEEPVLSEEEEEHIKEQLRKLGYV